MHHYLKRNESTQSPSNLLIVDTEAKILRLPDEKQEQTFRLGYAIHLMRKGNQWSESGYELKTIDDFWNLLDRIAYEKKRLYIIAHNMAYDYTILKMDTYLSSRNKEITLRALDSIFMICAGNIVLISSTNFYRHSLAELGSIFGFSKFESPDFEKCTDSELMTYCVRDAQVLTHIMKCHIAFFRDNNLGCFKPTIAGQALSTFRHRFMKHQLLIHVYPEILELERQSYRGGRCEAFKLGRFENITSLDINSMYPYVMKEFDYPTKLANSNVIHNCTVTDLNDYLSNYFLLADCNIELSEPFIACKNEKLLFPIGKIKQTITSPEIKYILDNPDCGKIVSVSSLVLYNQARIFSEYVDYFYHFRQTTKNDAYREMSKLMLNSLYGKFGQKYTPKPIKVADETEKRLFMSMMNEANTHEIITGIHTKYVRSGSDIYIIKRTEKESIGYGMNSIPIIASAVTSYARCMLWKLMKIAGLRNVYYCDTDSLFVNDAGVSNLQSWISPNELGKLKIEKTGTVEIRGAKDYVFNGITKLKGVKRNAEILPDGRFKQYTFKTKNARYKSGTPDGIVIVEPVIKSISREYTKGVVKDGSVHPFSFSQF